MILIVSIQLLFFVRNGASWLASAIDPVEPMTEPPPARKPPSEKRPARIPLGLVPPASPQRLPSLRACAVLAAAMLALGVAIGAAIGPTPKLARRGRHRLASRLPALLAALAGHGTSPRQAGPGGDGRRAGI